MEIEVKMRREKGITLIALVVTIIVLLILAGVSIMMLTGQNGILNRAGKAKEITGASQAEEELKLAITSLATEYYGSKTGGTLKDYIYSHEEELKKELGTTEVELDESGSTIKYKGKMYEVTEEGEITLIDGISISSSSMILEIKEDGTKQSKKIKATLVNVEGAVSWKTGDTNVATVESTGEEVTVAAVGVGRTTITATCGKYSKTCEVTVENEKTSYIDYDIDLDGDTSTKDWKLFYNDGTNIYIIAADYVKNDNANIPTTLGMSGVGNYTYNLYWSSSSDFKKTGTIDIFGETVAERTKYIGEKYLSTWKTATSTNNSAKMTASLMDTEAWSGFANSAKVKNLSSKDEELAAIGGPTVEMWVASWNERHGKDSGDENPLELYCNKVGGSENGYYLGTEDQATTTTPTMYVVLSATTGYKDKLFYPHTAGYDGCYGYWLASPGAEDACYEVDLYDYGGVSNNNYYISRRGVRPVVSLPSDITAEYNETEKIWNIVKK